MLAYAVSAAHAGDYCESPLSPVSKISVYLICRNAPYLGVRIGVGRRTGTDQIRVPIGTLDPGDGRQEFWPPGPVGREACLFPAVGMRPLVGGHPPHRMRRILEHVVLAIGRPRLDLPDLL